MTIWAKKELSINRKFQLTFIFNIIVTIQER